MMDRTTYRSLVRELATGPLQTLRSCVEHIAVEGAARPSSALQDRVLETCTRVGVALLDIGERVERVEALLDRDDPGDLSGPLETIADRLAASVREFDDAVGEVRASRGERDALLDILVHESGADILCAFHDAQRRLQGLARDQVGTTEERHVFACAECGARAVVFEVNRDRATGAPAVRASGIVRSETLAASEALLTSLRGRDAAAVHHLMPEGMDGYCPSCVRVYCRGHYVGREEYDDGFYDCTHATCPRGHTRMIDD